MAAIFNFLSLVSFVCLVVGVTDPETFTFLFRKKPKRSHVASVFIISTLVCLIIFYISIISSNPTGTGDHTTSQDQSGAKEGSIDALTPSTDITLTQTPK